MFVAADLVNMVGVRIIGVMHIVACIKQNIGRSNGFCLSTESINLPGCQCRINIIIEIQKNITRNILITVSSLVPVWCECQEILQNF